jgi:hypothetical protein
MSFQRPRAQWMHMASHVVPPTAPRADRRRAAIAPAASTAARSGSRVEGGTLWTHGELTRYWSPRDPYDRWPAAVATQGESGPTYQPILIHDIQAHDAVIIIPATDRPISTAVVPVTALVPLTESHRATRHLCVAMMERVDPATLEHFVDEWRAAQYADVADGRLVEPADVAYEDRTV